MRGRSVAIGSADFGNVTNVLFDECTVGDDQGSSPWAFKIKMHVNQASHISDVRIQNSKFGNITSNSWQDPGMDGGTALFIGMNYGGVKVDPTKPQPYVGNITFVNVTATQARVVGSFVGVASAAAEGGSIRGLHFTDCNFRATSATPWVLSNVDKGSCSSVDTTPAFPAQ